jgi:hypothetical protein
MISRTFITIILTVIALLLNLWSYRIIYLSLFDSKELIYPYTAYGAPELIDSEGLNIAIFGSFLGLVVGGLSCSISFWGLRPRVSSKNLKLFFTILTVLSLIATLLCSYRFIELLYHSSTLERCDNYKGNGFGCI